MRHQYLPASTSVTTSHVIEAAEDMEDGPFALKSGRVTSLSPEGLGWAAPLSLHLKKPQRAASQKEPRREQGVMRPWKNKVGSEVTVVTPMLQS